ncbi:MAG: RluA family pseudouridine synthase [Cyanobacteriota bacterium]|nr:RluA family pseudouridine synthase [Cyanobacteriota bacterium]
MKTSISAETGGQRLDRFLAERLADLSRSRIQQLIDLGRVRLNDRVCTSKKTTVQSGDRLEVDIPPPQPLELQPLDLPLDILYEDDQMAIVNKPAGLVVHPAPGHENDTLVNALLAHCDSLAGIGGVCRPGIVHRLDKDTTGAIAIAKTDLAHESLQAQLKEKTARRQYLGVVYGAPRRESGTIEQPLGRHRVDRKKMAIVSEDRGGRYARTHWQIQERLGNYTLMQFDLDTGRTHQIRVHSAHLGHPIVGDPVYGSGRSVGVNLPGQALHAWKLTLQHPLSGETLEAIAPLPEAFEKLLKVLRLRQQGGSAR